MKVEETIYSQYSNSSVIVGLVKGMDAHIRPDVDLEGFYRSIFGIESADGYGLNIWGKILNTSREIQINKQNIKWFGFKASGLAGFNQGVFKPAFATDTYTLTDPAFRSLLMLKCMINISDCSIPSLNTLLGNFFATRGRVYVKEAGIMRLRFVFEFYLKPFERALLMRENIVPKPAGVGYTWFETVPEKVFGFKGSQHTGFNQGTFRGVIYAPV